jgi:transposase
MSRDMHRLQELVRLHRLQTGSREVARLLGMSPNTERAYRLAIADAGLLDGDPEALPELVELRAHVLARWPEQAKPQHVSSAEPWRESIVRLLDDGLGPTAIHDRLRLEHSDFAISLSALKRLCDAIARARGPRADDVVIPVETPPGEIAQVDFGYVGKLWDPEARRVRKAWVFVMVLGWSRNFYAEIVFDQTIDTWLRVHVAAFECFGGVPKTIVPDNLKAAVVRAAFGVDEAAVLGRSYRELARHFGFRIDPAPIYSPEKKGKVENAIGYMKSNFFAARGEADASVLQAELTRWVNEIAGRRTHGTTRRQPLEAFLATERAALLSLPAKPWSPCTWREVRVHRDCHVRLEHALYSVPWRLVGKLLLARLHGRSVELYWEDARVAVHEQIGAGERRTAEEHLPAPRSAYRHRTREYWEERALKLGDDVLAYVRECFDSDDVLSKLRSVQAIVTLLERHPIARAQAACRRASFYGSYEYRAIKTILVKALDTEPLPIAIVPAAAPDAAPRFARDVRELLRNHEGDEDASN